MHRFVSVTTIAASTTYRTDTDDDKSQGCVVRGTLDEVV